MFPEHFKLAVQPIANPAAIVTAPQARFAALTSRLLRLEYSSIDRFEDRATQVFWYRAQPVPDFAVEREADRVVITTAHLCLTYRFAAQGFTRESLSIEVKATGQTWKYGDRGEWKNLRGTTRTLDEVNGAVGLERGLLSRDGWAVIDDSTAWSLMRISGSRRVPTATTSICISSATAMTTWQPFKISIVSPAARR